jgi:hypothetical protein
VVASTDMNRVSIMMTRIHEQLEKVADFTTIGELTLSAEPVTLPDPADPLEKRVQEVANRVTEMARLALGPTQNSK